MRWPLVPVVLGYAAGLLLADLLQPAPLPLFIAAAALALLALARARLRPCLLWALLILAGAANLASRASLLSPHDLRAKPDLAPRLVTARGVLLDTPTPRVWVRDAKESWRFVARIGLSALNVGGAEWEPASGTVLVTTPGHAPDDLFAGQAVEVLGLLTLPPKAAADGLFDYRAYLARQGIYFVLKPAGAAQWSRLGPPRSPPFTERFLRWAQRMLALGLPAEDEALRLLWAMTLGSKGGVDSDFYEPFMLSGTMHIFAISGLHIVLIAGFLTALLVMVRVPRGWAGWLVIPLIWFYTWATGWQASAVRATIMVSVVLVGYGLRRPSNLVNSLAAAALLILVWEPRELFGASFQLSFGVVLALAVLGSPLVAMLRRVRFYDGLLPEGLAPWWKRALERLWGGVAAPSLATTIAACAGALPLTAEYFHIVSPVTLLANLVVVPLSGLALGANLGSLIIGGVWPAVAGLLNHAAWAFMMWMIEVSKWAAGLPWGRFNVTSPPWLFHTAWYGGMVLLWYQQREGETRGGGEGEGEGKDRRDVETEKRGGGEEETGRSIGQRLRQRLGGREWGWAGCGVGLVVALGQWNGMLERAGTRLTVLPLSGGMGVLAEGEGTWLVDPGNRDAAQRLTKPLLRARGVDWLEGLALTHGDSLHVAGATQLAHSFSVERVLTTSVRQRSAAYRRVIAEFESGSTEIRQLRRGDEAGPWRVLHPPEGARFSRADDSALVLLGEFAGTRVLLLSDLGYAGQQALLEMGGGLRAEVVIAGLPSLGEPLCEALLDAIRPKVIIIGDSEFPATERADAELVARLRKRGVLVFCTQAAGVMRIEITREGWKVAGEGEGKGD